MDSESPFFDIPQAEWIAANRSAFAIWDGYPVSPGHALVVSRRLITNWWEATPGERADIFDLVDIVRDKIAEMHGPDGFNVGFNEGSAAGQTVDHLHIHVIPRFAGDVPEPSGGIRNVLRRSPNHSTGPTPAS
ncbi:HIT family protein [Mycolicibacterium sp. XJ870]